MLSWYREKLRQLGFVTATVLLFRVAGSRIVVDLSNRLLPPRVSCPCCGWTGRRYYSYIEVAYSDSNVVCPQCDSHPRHRLFFLWLTKEYGLKDKKGVAVVFAPERSLESIWQGTTDLQILRADFETTRDVDVLVDLQRLPLNRDAVDLLWCHHVLEHIEDDGAAMKELYRTLRPVTGELIVSVPMIDAPKTKEYGFSDPKDSGHWRIYGEDFADKLTYCGFDVRKVDFQLTDNEVTKFGLDDEDSKFYLCRKPAMSDT